MQMPNLSIRPTQISHSCNKSTRKSSQHSTIPTLAAIGALSWMKVRKGFLRVLWIAGNRAAYLTAHMYK